MTTVPQRPSPFPAGVECEAPPVPVGGDFRLLRPFAIVIGYIAGYATGRAADAWRGTLGLICDVPAAFRRMSFRRRPKAPGKVMGICVTPNGLRVPPQWKRAC